MGFSKAASWRAERKLSALRWVTPSLTSTSRALPPAEAGLAEAEAVEAKAAVDREVAKG
ncbi:hypothetical protein D3C76_1726440 [compost metagenome]